MKSFKFILLALSFSLFVMSCNDDDDFAACTADTETGIVTEVSTEEANVSTSIVINATPEQVWDVLTDFTSYPDWSTTFQGLEGDIRNGGQVMATFPDGMGNFLPFTHELIYEDNVRFGWSDPILIFPGIVDNHFYTVEACGSETVFSQTDEFIGTDNNITPLALANLVLESYQIFNSELKTEVESRF